MVWLNPAALALLAFVPVLLVLHALRYRRRDVQVSTLFLWESVAREAQGSLGLRRLVQNLPLLLQILLVCLLAAALAEPALTGEAVPSRDVVLVLDVSASMQARGERGTRFEQAREHALRLLQELPAGRQMAVITAGRQPRMASFFSGDKPLLRQTLRDLQAGDGPGNMREALFLALSLTQGSGSREIVVIGDGAYPHAAELTELRQQLGGQLRHIRVDGGETNVGITRFAFRQVPDTEGLYEVLLTAKNFSPQPVTAPLRLSLPPQGPLQRELHLQPGEEEVVVSTVAGPLRGVAEAELALEDDLELDNRAYGIAAAPDPDLDPARRPAELLSGNPAHVHPGGVRQRRAAGIAGNTAAPGGLEPADHLQRRGAAAVAARQFSAAQHRAAGRQGAAHRRRDAAPRRGLGAPTPSAAVCGPGRPAGFRSLATGAAETAPTASSRRRRHRCSASSRSRTCASWSSAST